MHIDSTRLRELRTAKRWSQEQLAELSGLNLRTIQRLETGAKVSTESLRALAAVFEVPAETLLVRDPRFRPNAPSQAVLDAMLEGVVRGLDFTGISPRPAFWWFMLAVVMVLGVGEAFAELLGPFPARLVGLIVLLPWIAASCRRLRDAGLSPWWTLIALAPVGGILILLWLWTFPSKAAETPEEAKAF